MLFFYIRHGDPIYNPDMLTPLGERQAEAVGRRLALYGVDKIYSSTSNRAIQTAKPACEMLKIEVELLDFCNESHAWNDFTVIRENKKTWYFQDKEAKELFSGDEVLSLGYEWYKHPFFADGRAKKGLERISAASNELFSSLGYERFGTSGRYKVTKSNKNRVALFAHQGFGSVFLSLLLNIPYPLFCLHFEMCHTGMTVIDFVEQEGYAIPQVLTLSSDSHLYREGLPTYYNGRHRF